jgi:hypothetical protein
MTKARDLASNAAGAKPTLVDAKGDLLAGSAADTVARLAVGANDTVLTADSTAATGLKWSTPSSGGMTLLSTTSLSGATTTISGISGSYNHLYVSVYDFQNATGNGYFRVAPNGSTNIVDGAYQTRNTNDVSTNDYIYASPGQLVNRSGTDFIVSFTIFDYTNTSAYKTVQGNFWYNTDAAALTPGMFSAGIKTTSAITSLVFSNSGGNYSAGTVLLYGVK